MTDLARTMAQAVQAMADKEGKYLTFALGGEEYGIGILKVREIIGMMEVTALPQAPDYVKGVINLRGRVIPIICLRRKFGLEAADYTERTCIVVVEITAAGSAILAGLVVDAVAEVINIRSEEIEPTPALGAGGATRFIMGIAKTESGVRILLDIDQLIDADELAVLAG